MHRWRWLAAVASMVVLGCGFRPGRIGSTGMPATR
jgi:hypothetical protein